MPRSPPYNSYGSGDASVAEQLSLLSPHVNKLATYGAGYAGTTPPRRPGTRSTATGSSALPPARQQSRPSQGVRRQPGHLPAAGNAALQAAEIDGAFEIAAHANADYAGTVTRLIFTNEYVTDETTTNEVLAMIQANKTRAGAAGLDVGVRSNTWGNLTGPAGAYKTALENLVKECDFIMINYYPSEASVLAGAAASVTDGRRPVQHDQGRRGGPEARHRGHHQRDRLAHGRQGLQRPRRLREHAGQLRGVLQRFEAWTRTNQVESYWFEGIDEPWKSDQNQVGGNVWTGPDGAEGHYGLYTYSGTGDTGTFSSKWTLAENYDRVPVVPEPTGLALLALGAALVRRRIARVPRAS